MPEEKALQRLVEREAYIPRECESTTKHDSVRVALPIFSFPKMPQST